MNEPTKENSSLRDYLGVLRRRKWIVLQAAILVPLLTIVLTLRQDALYEGYAEVLLSRQNLATGLTGIADPASQGGDFETITQTQAKLAVVPAVAQRVLDDVGVRDRTPVELLKRTEVTAAPDADILEFRVIAETERLAARLTTEFARQYTLYKRELDTASLTQARAEVQARLDELDDPGSPLYASLVEKDQQLSTLEALQISNASVTRPSDEADQIQPKPLRNTALGLLLGLLLGTGLAFLRDALDTRLRSDEEVTQLLQLPMLARLPAPPGRLGKKQRLATLEDPFGALSEPFRILRMNLEMVTFEQRPRVVMVTSAIEAEGKSTTVANLAVSLALGGWRVALVDLDLRRPALHRFFDLDPAPGLTTVAIGGSSIDDALVPIQIMEGIGGGRQARRDSFANGRPGGQGSLEVLPSGPMPPNPGEFLGTQPVADTLAQLRERADIVLVDTPPLLPVGDASATSRYVDSMLLVVRLAFTTRPILRELNRTLDIAPAAKMGFVVTGTASRASYGYRYGGRYHAEAARSRQPV